MKRTSLFILTALVAVFPLAAQQKTATKAPAAKAPVTQHPVPLDRNQIPVATAAPTFKVPAYTIDTLSNGARLVVVTRHKLPIVNFSMHFDGGTNALGVKQTVASFLGSMTREGTETRSADQLANDLAMLGTGIAIGVGTESGSAGFSTLVHTFDRSMDLMMDMMLHSTYPAAALERLRTAALVTYQSSQDALGTVAGQVAPRILYGDQPYGQVTTDADLKAVTRDDVANLARRIFVPANATVYVVGDMTRAQAKIQIERAFKGWSKSGQKLAFSYPAAPAVGATTIYLVDMPGKPQSYLRLTRAGTPAFGPDMARIDMANYILGGGLQSRLSANIREAHGYSYGFNSGVSWLKGPGPLSAAGSVTREKTDSSVLQAVKEIRGMSGARPVTTDELNAAKSALTLSLPSRLQSNAGVSGVVARIVDEGLPKDWWSQYIATVNATTATDVAAIAAKYFDADHLVIVVAGDGAKITDALKKSGIAPVVMVDKMGKKIP